MNKELFYEKLQPYFENKLIREVYSSDTACILSLGEICYVACPYVLVNDIPAGSYVNKNVMTNVVQYDDYIFELMKKIYNDIHKYKRLYYNFSADEIDNYKKWIAENTLKGISEIDYDFENEINNMKKQRRGILK